jgi:hypothetical protein
MGGTLNPTLIYTVMKQILGCLGPGIYCEDGLAKSTKEPLGCLNILCFLIVVFSTWA